MLFFVVKSVALDISFVTSVDIYQSTWPNIPKDKHSRNNFSLRGRMYGKFLHMEETSTSKENDKHAKLLKYNIKGFVRLRRF
jgi:hypothetical protein